SRMARSLICRHCWCFSPTNSPRANLNLGKIYDIAREQYCVVSHADRGELEVHSANANSAFLKLLEDPSCIFVKGQDCELYQRLQTSQELSVSSSLRHSSLLAIDKSEPAFKRFLCGDHGDEHLGLLGFDLGFQMATDG